MKKSAVISRLSSGLLIWVLAFQIGFAPALLSAQDQDGEAHETLVHAEEQTLPEAEQQQKKIERFYQLLNKAGEDSRAPDPVDNFYLNDQGLLVYETVEEDGKFKDKPVQAYDYLKDRNIPEVSVINPLRDLRLAYSPEKKEIRIEHIRWDSRRKRTQVTHAHYLRNIELTTRQNHFVSDTGHDLNLHSSIGSGKREYVQRAPLMVLFSALSKAAPDGEKIPSGVRAFAWPLLTQLVFKTAIPSVVVVPGSDIPVLDMEILTPESTPREQALAGDLELQVAVQEAPTDPYGRVSTESMAVVTKTQPVRVSREEIGAMLVTQLEEMLKYFMVLSPEAGLLDEIAQRMLDAKTEKDLAVVAINNLKESILDSGSTTLSRELVRQVAVNTDLKRLWSLAGPDGEIATLMKEPRHVLDEKTWPAEHEIIKNERVREAEMGTPAKPWRQILVESLASPSVEIEKKAEKVEILEKKASSRYLRRIVDLTKAIVTPKRAAVLSSAFAYDLINRSTNGVAADWLVSLLSRTMSWTLEVPVLKHAARMFASTGDYLHEPWAAARLTVAIGAVLALRPLSIFLVDKYSKLKKTGWGSVKAFFTYGTRVYAAFLWLGYGPQKFVIEKIGRQKNVYHAMDLGMNPVRTRSAWHWPWASKEKVAKARENLEQVAKNDVLRRARAITFAAAIVSEKRNIDVPTLLMAAEAAEQNALKPFLQSLGTKPAEITWQELAMKVYAALNELHDKGVGTVTAETKPEELAAYVSALNNVATQIDEIVQSRQTGASKKLAYRVGSWTKEKAKGWSRLLADSVLPFVLVGRQPYLERKKYAGFEASEQGAKIANLQYKEDYDFSAYFYGFSDPKLFGGAVSGNAEDVARLSGDQVEQNLLYGLFNGYDVEATLAADASVLSNVFAPLTNDRLILKRIREQSAGEAAENIMTDAADPKGDSYFGVHQRTLNANLTGFQVRMMAGVIPKTVSLAAIAIFANPGSVTTALSVGVAGALKSIPKQAVIILKKYGISPDGDVGYATVWPGVRNASKALEKKVASNLEAIQKADVKMDSGEWPKMKEATTELIAMYESSKTPLPPHFNTPIEAYTPELARELWQYSLSGPEAVPAPTKASHVMQAKILNTWYGALISTLLYLNVSRNFYNPNVSVWPQLVDGMITMAVTYAGISILKEASPTILKIPGLRWAAAKAGSGLRVGMKVVGKVWNTVTWPIRKAKQGVVACAAILSGKAKRQSP